MSKTEWTTEFPTESGRYWFYGYRYGKISCGYPCELVLMSVEAKCSNGMVYIADGHFMYESEVEEPHFCKADLPDLPKLKGKENV